MSIVEVFVCRRLQTNTSMISVCIRLKCRLCTALHTKCCGAVCLDEEDIKNSITCTSGGQALLYTATISYSSASADITGSTLAAQLVAWLLVQGSPTLIANGHTFKVYPVMSAPQAVSVQAGPVTGGFIGRLSIGVLSTSLVAI